MGGMENDIAVHAEGLTKFYGARRGIEGRTSRCGPGR
jgi:hypothetical protein